MIDTHCHLVDEKYLPEEVGAIIQRGREAGIAGFVSAGAGFDHTKESIKTAEKYDEVFATVGLGYDPGEKYDLAVMETLAANKKVVAIGECGLDYWPSMREELKTKQKELFLMHIELAEETGLPLVVHCRNAFEDIYDMIRQRGIIGMMHCFTGNYEWMRRFVDLGWYISFGGIVTFKKSEELREVVRQTPEERILVETDAPYLAPEPIRGERNTPENVMIIAKMVANLRKQSMEQVECFTTKNAKRLFSKMI